ncbi:hypothetical protein KUV80_03310 [Fictibacillus nanhaiensis]|uniref:hypothetical protein n=1 Tax=Fictibacillus nanhaiensis TaxID=742169 RepID=UPI001C974BF3|nr:hypothetical protein [Fictibacillus nanhaiensis]MBY6035660.1 hypothetical protein [Fictibacillus nanhaiensis]
MENDQAERLREKTKSMENVKTSSLPSRSDLHGKKREKRKKKEQTEKDKNKSSFIVTRLLLVAFILLVVLTVTYQFWSQNIYVPVHSEDNKGVKQVKIEH